MLGSPRDDSRKRSEKLAKARRKLKQYQARSGRPSSRSSTVDEKENDPRSSFESLPTFSSFHHDEHRSPFQRVRGPSGSVGSQDRPSLASRHSVASEPSLSPQNYVDAMSNYVDTTPPQNYVDATQNYVNPNFTTVNIPPQNPEVQPQTSPATSNEFELTPSAAVSGTESQNYVDATQNYVNPNFQTVHIPFQNPQTSPATSNEFELTPNAAVSGTESSPVVVSTPTLQVITMGETTPLSGDGKKDLGGMVLTDNSDDSHELVSSPSINPPSTERSGEGSQDATVDTDTRFEELQHENHRLENSLQHEQEKYEQVTLQFQQLHAHYTQLHQVYSELQSRQQAIVNDSERSEALAKRVQQHEDTMAVLVQEKTAVQSQLKQAMEIANSKHLENEELQGRLQANREKLSEVEKSLEKQNSGRTELEQTLQKQKTELQKRSQESCTWEAKVIEMQQDRSELQARLKVKSRELDKMYAEMGDLRKELQMKEIYIRQLSAHAAGVVQMQEHEQTIASLKSDSDRLSAELSVSQKASDQWKTEAQQSREQYETYGRQLNQKIVELSQQLEQLSEEKLSSDSKVQSLEQQLNELQPKEEATVEADTSSELLQKAVEHVTVAELETQLRDLQENYALIQSQNLELMEKLKEKDTTLQSLQCSLQSKDRDLSRAQEDLSERTQCSTDTRTLLEQIQSERATVSRAVAQNRELKEQLAELQDRFVRMSEQNMDATSQAQSAQFQIQTLTDEWKAKEEGFATTERSLRSQIEEERGQKSDLEQRIGALHAQLITYKTDLDDAKTALKSEKQEGPEFQESATETEEVPETSNSELVDENSNLRARAESLEAELTHLRSVQIQISNENLELHRIMEQNAEDENQNTIHVELQHALDRINALVTENQALRVQLAESQMPENSGSSEEEQRITNGDENSSICSEHNDQKRDQAFENLKSAMDQLQTRFTRAMAQNADLSEQNQHLEHLITQLQSETDTIGEYITIYQHQRKVIRERLKDRENSVATLSRDKEGMHRKLVELQDLVMRVLREQGALHPYAQGLPSRRKHSPSPQARPSPDSPHPQKDRTRLLSHSTVDELSGDEETVVDFSKKGLLTIRKSIDSNALVNGETSEGGSPRASLASDDVDLEASPRGSAPDYASLRGPASDSGTAERILRLLTEMQTPELAEKLPIVDRNLHCKECKGKLIVL